MKSVIHLIRQYNWAFYAACFVLLLLSALPGYHLLQDTGGTFSLPHNGAYLQAATAKTLAFNRIWGIGREGFSAASPSLLYPLILAVLFFIFGPHLVIVPILNMAIAVILLAAVQQWLKKRSIKTVNQLFILLAIIALTPLPLIVTYGMERPLLLLFAFLFVSRMSDEWFSPEFSRTTLICGALMVATRYDGALLVALPCLLLLWRRKLLEAFELALWCLLPALVFGILAVFKENYFLPSPFMVMPVSSLVSYDWLVGCGIAVALPLLSGAGFQRLGHKTSRVAGVAATLIALMLCTKNMYAFREARRSSLEAYRLEYPAAQFVRRYYFRYGIVSDDVGSISFLTEGRYVDLSGNASIKIARSRGHHSPDPNLVNQLSMEKRTHVAIVSDKYARALPQNWVRTASWQWNGVAGEESKTLYFYALDSITAGVLKPELEEFAYFLPKNVTARYFFNPR